jgi:2-aminoadipate transaminase
VRPIFQNAPESPIRAMLPLADEPGMISLAGGHPDPDLLPHEWVAESAQRVLGRMSGRDLQYGATEGIPPLRESASAMLAARRINAPPDSLLVTTGSQQGISLVASVLLDPGDAVAMAPYNYPSAVHAVRFAGANLVALSDDGEGLDELARSHRGRVKAAYLVPDFANPTGHVMSFECRLRLLESAAKHDVCVIEDDPYGELWFDQPPPDSLCALNQNWKIGANVVYLTSFSKILAPALRLGVLLAPPALRRPVKLAKQAADVHSGLLEQRFLDEMLRDERRLAVHLAGLRAAYREKAHAMVNALREAAATLSFTRPSGGMFVWARMRDGAVDREIDWFAFGRRHRVLALPGKAFCIDDGHGPFVRLSFANPSIADVREGVKRLIEGLRV